MSASSSPKAEGSLEVPSGERRNERLPLGREIKRERADELEVGGEVKGQKKERETTAAGSMLSMRHVRVGNLRLSHSLSWRWKKVILKSWEDV